MRGLASLLVEHAETLEADLLRFYDLDLLDLYRGRWSLRRLAVLVRTLPPDSATVRAAEPRLAWSSTEYLLAEVVDLVAVGNWQFIEANKKKGAKNPQPERIPRPAEVVASSAARATAAAVEAKPPLLSGSQFAGWLRGATTKSTRAR